MDYIESWLERQNRLDTLVKSDDYKNWLVDCVDKYGHFSDDTFVYMKDVDEKTKEYSQVLSYFFSMIGVLVEEQRATFEDIDYETTYYFKLKNNYYEIDTICGQGAITSIRKTKHNSNINYVLLDENIDEDELDKRKLVKVFIFNDDLDLNTNEKFEIIVKLTLSNVSKYLNKEYSINGLENCEHWFLKCNGNLLRKIKEENDCCDIVNSNNEIVAISLKHLSKAKIKEITKDCVAN